MATEIQSSIRTLGEVLDAMAPFAGRSVLSADSIEYANFVTSIAQKQEEYARRGFWRRCLTRLEISLDSGFTTVLPERFHKPNGLFMLIVDGVDWNEVNNTDDQYIFIEMINDVEDENFGLWQMRFKNELLEDKDAVMWYFSNPPKPTTTDDILLLPGDMVAYAALQEYYRTTGSEGSEDNAKELAENRFAEYLGLEVLPDKKDLLTHSQGGVRVDRLQKAKAYYRSRINRPFQR